MSKLLQDKVIAITGAGGGLGRAYALYMAQLGAKLVINDLGGAVDGTGSASSAADRVVAELKALGAEAVANHASVSTMEGGASVVESAVKAFGRLDVLVNNAGILRDKTLLNLSEEMWDLVIAVHLKGTFACTLPAAAQMKAQGSGGSIINTTSFAGLKGNYGQSNYGAAKAGIYGLTLVAAMELRRFNIRVNAIAPLAKTRMTESIDMVPASMTAEHVAPLVAFLASDLSKDLSGRTLGIHGGHIFEYKMQTTEGVVQPAWEPQAIGARLPEIAGEVPVGAAPAASAPAPAASAPAPAAAPAVAAPQTPQEEIASIFRFMPSGFQPEKAKGWNAVLHWEIAGTGDFTISVSNGACTSAAGKSGSATCVVKTDTPTFLGIVGGTVDGTQAYMQGKISATNVADLMKYQKTIDGKKARAAFEASLKQAPAAAPAPAAAAAAPAPAAAPAAAAVSAAPQSPQEEIASIFKFMPSGFLPEKAKGWNAVLHWEIAGTGDFTISVSNGACTSAAGKSGSATCVIKTDTKTFLGIVGGTVDGTQAYMQGKISATNVADLMKYQKTIDGKKARAAFEASLKGAAPTAAAPAAAPVASAPAAAAAPAAPPAAVGKALLEAAKPLDKLRLLVGLMPELGARTAGPDSARVHLTAGPLRCTIARAAGKTSLEAGHTGEATSRVLGTPEALCALLLGGPGRDLFSRAEVTATSMDELRWLIACAGPDPTAALVEELQERGSGLSRAAEGAAYHGDPIIVTHKEIRAFAEATNDLDPRYLEVGRSGGVIAPPLFPVRYLNLIYGRVLTDPALGLDVSRLLFGEMELRFGAPIRPKDLLVVKAQVRDIEDKETGQVMRLAARLMCEGEPKVNSVATFFVKWASRGKSQRLQEPRAEGTADAKVFAFEEPMKIRDDQTRLFAPAANDPNPVHLDDNFAKAAGLPGIIVHGLCSMAFAGRAFIQRVGGGDPTRLAFLKVRFSKPARPGQTLITRALPPSTEGEEKVYAFTVTNNEGELIISDGIARVRP